MTLHPAFTHSLCLVWCFSCGARTIYGCFVGTLGFVQQDPNLVLHVLATHEQSVKAAVLWTPGAGFAKTTRETPRCCFPEVQRVPVPLGRPGWSRGSSGLGSRSHARQESLQRGCFVCKQSTQHCCLSPARAWAHFILTARQTWRASQWEWDAGL